MPRPQGRVILKAEPLWYKDAVVYELHVRAFADSDGDGIGDFPGLTGKLDYLRGLGITALWLLPFYPSPLRDDGYDIADYTDIHPSYGTLHDFNVFLKEAHRRGIRVITELIINHTSDQHPWFQRARQEPPTGRYRNFYVWSDSPDRYPEARIIFKDFEASNWTWDPVAKAYYWHRFYAHQPDLNFDSPLVRQAVRRVLDFWLGLGVDGLRLDAVPYLVERDGTTCENLPETHAYLKDLRRYVDQRYKHRMFLAEANQWPEDASAYFGSGDECHMTFHFPLMPRLFMATRMESRFPVMEILEQTPPIPEGCQWAIFLRNHDELTLEMVTDEERDYMYRVYAQDAEMRINLGIRRRLAPLLGNNRRKIELLNGLLLSLPGTPVIYYGDEIGMGDNVYLGDRNGVRTPMQWNGDRNAGFSRANPQQLYLPVIIDPEYHYEALNVEAQHRNPSSLLWWMKRLIGMRARSKAFGRGTLEFLHPENPKVLAYIRAHEDERNLVVANLSRFSQCVELDLSRFNGMRPVELFGRTEFPPIGELPYFVTLGPHSFYWFALEAPAPAAGRAAEELAPALELDGGWDSLLQGDGRAALARVLPEYFKASRWFGGKARGIHSAEVSDVLPITDASALTLVAVRHIEGEPSLYLLPLAYASGPRAQELLRDAPRGIVARARHGDVEGVLYDAVHDPEFCKRLLEAMGRRKQFKGEAGRILASPTKAFRAIQGAVTNLPDPWLLGAEQSNTSIVYADRTILKLFRRLEEGINPDLEIGRFLTEQTSFMHFPRAAGSLEYQRDRKAKPMTLGFLQGFTVNEGDAWSYTLDAVDGYLERVLAKDAEQEPSVPKASLVGLLDDEVPAPAAETIGMYLEAAKLLGARTAELHLALASSRRNPDFDPEPFTPHSQRSVYQSMRSQAMQALQLLRKRLASLDAEVRPLAQQVLDREKELLKRFELMLKRKLTAGRIRCHGDYHLGQVLFTGKDFVMLDFEGEPARSLTERRLKRCPLRDVAGMIRSFHYASAMALVTQRERGGLRVVVRPEHMARVTRWVALWYSWVSVGFLRTYLEIASGAAFLPKTREELGVLLDAYLLEKAAYELTYELNNRPAWARTPLQGILDLLDAGAA